MSGPLRGIGRRGACLILFALVFATYGFATAGTQPVRPGLDVITKVIPMNVLAFLCIAAGVAAIASVIVDKPWIGYAVLFFPPGAFAVSNVVSYILFLCKEWFGLALCDSSHTCLGSPLAYAGALVWTLILGVLAIISGWPEPATHVEVQ